DYMYNDTEFRPENLGYDLEPEPEIKAPKTDAAFNLSAEQEHRIYAVLAKADFTAVTIKEATDSIRKILGEAIFLWSELNPGKELDLKTMDDIFESAIFDMTHEMAIKEVRANIMKGISNPAGRFIKPQKGK